MAFGLAVNCVGCKLLVSQILVNAKQERLCADCLQKEYNTSCDNLERAFGELHKAVKKNEEIVTRLQIYDAVLEQITNLIQLSKT